MESESASRLRRTKSEVEEKKEGRRAAANTRISARGMRGWGAERNAPMRGRLVGRSAPDKISNLKFHRNFTILGSELIVLSERGRTCHDRGTAPASSRTNGPLPDPTWKISRAITHYTQRSYRPRSSSPSPRAAGPKFARPIRLSGVGRLFGTARLRFVRADFRAPRFITPVNS